MGRLKYLAAAAVDELKNNVKSNLSRYKSGDFIDLMAENEWSIELDFRADLSPLRDLIPSDAPQAQIVNTELVWRALGDLTPQLACEEGIWVRLTHVECLEFSRKRWLTAEQDEDTAEKMVRLHFFAATRDQRRDDNSISRLWWNAFIAYQVGNSVDLSALDFLLRRADTRSNLIERSHTGSRIPLTQSIIRTSKKTPWVIESEMNFRRFMIAINKFGGGKVFEVLPETEIDNFVHYCALQAGMPDSLPSAE